MPKDIISFLREKDYIFLKKLGQGACGETVLLKDDLIDENFVCKKLSPISEEYRIDFYKNFVREIKLLHKILHKNVVRIFNFYLYPKNHTGYILMEYIQGNDIYDFIAKSPELINEIFIQTINGFSHLEEQNILHRDIRPQNIMVNEFGIVKIIDFGFGKEIIGQEDFDKSMSLILWCEPPEEFSKKIYDFKSEIYFIGKLFEKIILENRIEFFRYKTTLDKMCKYNSSMRIDSFRTVENEISTDITIESDFNEDEILIYRQFSDTLVLQITKIEDKSKYRNDIDFIITELKSIYRKTQLEEFLPTSVPLVEVFIIGTFYFKNQLFSVENLKNFTNLLNTSTAEQKRIILANIQYKLDAVSRYSQYVTDDLPF